MKNVIFRLVPFLCFAVTVLVSGLVWAQTGAPHDWQMGFQEPASPVAERLDSFHNMLLVIIGLITLFVTVLMIYVMVRFNAKANPEPSKVSHNTMLEVIWTAVPVVILLIIVLPSVKLIYYQDRIPEPEMTLKVTGYQWYWGYDYPDHDDISFMSYMLPDEELDASKGHQRLLSTDRPAILPVDTNIQILVTAADVLHGFAIPSLGMKIDAIPGRINQTWVRIEEPGVYYGQCSELCGKDHAFMPIEIHAVSKEEFQQWVASGGEAEISAAVLESTASTVPVEIMGKEMPDIEINEKVEEIIEDEG